MIDIELAKDAFENRQYLLAAELFERCINHHCNNTIEIYRWYGDSLARAGRLKESFDVFGHICSLLNYHIPLDQLNHLSYALIQSIFYTLRCYDGGNSVYSSVDPLCCPICLEVLKQPVTGICGHTFCRQCCRQCINCPVCPSYKFLSLPNQNLEQDIFVKRLIERWWSSDSKSIELNDEAIRHLENNSLNDALRYCNKSLNNGKSLHILNYQIFLVFNCRVDRIYITAVASYFSSIKHRERLKWVMNTPHFQSARLLVI